MRLPLLAAALSAAAFSIGCGGSKAPEVDPAQLPRVLTKVESLTEEIIGAFDSGEPFAADHALHEMSKVHNSLGRIAQAVLPAEDKASMAKALENHLDALAILHAPMHKDVFPEDFEFEPVRKKLLDSLEAMRSAAPADVVAEMDEAKEKRQASREAMAAAETKAAEEPSAGEEPAEPINADESAEDTAKDTAAEPDPTDTGAAPPPPPGGRAAIAGRAPLCPSVMMYDEESNRLAAERINRAALALADASPDARWVQLVPTLHTVPRDDGTLAGYGRMISRNAPWDSSDNYLEATDGLADRFRDTFAAAIRQAVRRGLHLAILPHLDPALLEDSEIEWRNHFRFRPGETIGAGSYESLLIDPLVEAIEAEAYSTTQVDFSVSGEMGLSLFEHPEDYRALVQRLRKRFAANPRAPRVRFGVALNWSGLAGGADPATLDRDAVAELFSELDFVGFSCYAPVSTPPTVGDFNRATANFLAELGEWGGTLPPNATLEISEVGIGGGQPERTKNAYAFASVSEVAAKPYEGSGNPPANPWSSPTLAILRTQFHAALLAYLSGPQTPPINKAFLWSEGPWDPQGVSGERFHDAPIARLIADHNSGANR